MSNLSLCCGAPPIGETDLCSACKEHSGFGDEAPTVESAVNFVERCFWKDRRDRLVAQKLRDAAIRADGVRDGMERAAHLADLLSQDDCSARYAAKRIRAAAQEVKP